MVRLLRERSAYEANLLEENNGLLLAASVFPYFYALVGERNREVRAFLEHPLVLPATRKVGGDRGARRHRDSPSR